MCDGSNTRRNRKRPHGLEDVTGEKKMDHQRPEETIKGLSLTSDLERYKMRQDLSKDVFIRRTLA
uniref:Uncharacterized protein n=1 Tax=Knipowitschia caucasica TaxID=637954 RepID=A0AAV2M925_KNICA